MNHLPFHTAHHWITQLTQLPHPITINHIPPLAAELGWKPSKDLDEYLYEHDSSSTLIQIPYNKKTTEVYWTSFPVALIPNPTLDDSINLADLYFQYLHQARKVWGNPIDNTTNPTGGIWQIHQYAYIQLDLHPEQIIISCNRVDPNGSR